MKGFKLFGITMMIAAAILVIYGCPGRGNGPAPEDRAELRQDIQEGINRIDQRMQALQDSSAAATGMIRDRMMQQQEMLRARRSDLNQRLNNIDTVTAEQWEEFKTSSEQTLDDLDTVLGTMEDELEDLRQQGTTGEGMPGTPDMQGTPRQQQTR